MVAWLLALALAAAPAPASQRPGGGYARADRPVTGLKPRVVIRGGYYTGGFGQVNGVYCDAASGEIYVADAASNAVQIYDENGAWLFSFSDAENLEVPQRLVADAEGRIYVTDGDSSRIKVFSYRGEYLSDLPVPGVSVEKPRFTALALDANGDFVVGESVAGEVLVFDRGGRLKLRFGGYGEHEGQFRGIAGIALDAERIYVASQEGVAVQVFSRNGRLLRAWGEHADGKQNVSLPAGIAVDAKGRVVLLDTLRQEIKYFDAEGRLIDLFGGGGRAPGAVAFPTAMMMDARGRLCVSDSGNNRMQVLTPIEADAAQNARAQR